MHSKKIPLGLISALALVPFTLMAGENDASKSIIEAPYIDPWADTIHPISNPTHFDLAIPQTQIHPIFIHNSMPDVVDTILGDVHVGGDYQVYALQVELALSDRLSLNATKDGYIDFNPESTLAKTEGFANIAAGVKYAWLYQPENQLASNIQLLFEVPAGNRSVWQGEGDGVFIPSVSTLKMMGDFQLANQFGFKLPVDNNAESSVFYTSAHVSYKLNDWIRPLAEVNWFRVIDSGDGGQRFNDHVGGALTSIAAFEAGDLVNWGAGNATQNRNFVSAALGFRVTIPDSPIDLGFAWELPLTDESAGIMKDRLTLDMVIKF
ncbi:MAG: transporter [Verrucomicrobiales bacterium]